MHISQKKLYIVEVFCQFVNVNFPDFAQRAAFFKNIADLHCLVGVIRIGFKRNGDKIAAVKFFADNTGTEGVAVQTDHKVKDSGAVGGFYGFGVFVGAEDFLGEVKRAFFALFKGKTWVVFKLRKGNGLVLCQRVIFPYVDVSGAVYEGVKFYVIVAENLLYYLSVKVV